MQEQLNAYKALYETAKQHRDFISDQHFRPIQEKVEELELSVEFGMPLLYSGNKWYDINTGGIFRIAHLGFYGEEHHRTISWSDDGRQPENEWLCVISFPTGAYIFGDYLGGKYPQETFSKFFEELKSYGAKYCDTMNSNLYFTSEAAHKVVKDFPEIFKKYKDMCQQEYERNRVKELEAELAKLKGN